MDEEKAISETEATAVEDEEFSDEPISNGEMEEGIKSEEEIAALTLLSLKNDKQNLETTINAEASKNRVLENDKQSTSNLTDKKQRTFPKFLVERLEDIVESHSEAFEKEVKDRDMSKWMYLKKEIMDNVLLPFLEQSEREMKKIDVKVYDSEGEIYDMALICHEWNGSKKWSLRNGWRKFRGDHNLEADKDYITAQAFRHKETKKLCFVIISRRIS